MRSSIEALDRDIADMLSMTSSIKPTNALLAQSSDPEVQAYLSVRRRFDYSGLIIALYASFESFVEDILRSYVVALSKHHAYESLPAKLTQKHLKKSGDLLSRPIDVARYPGATHTQMVENLARCMSGARPYGLNHMAVTAHDGNLRYLELEMLLGLVEISCEEVGGADPLVKWYLAAEGTSDLHRRPVPKTVMEERLKGLVERRNELAHRGGNPQDRLGTEAIEELVKFIHALAESIFILLAARYLSRSYVDRVNSEPLKLARGPYHGNTTWVVERPLQVLRINQPVFAISNTFKIRWGRIQSLQPEETAPPTVGPGKQMEVGVRLDFAAPKTARLYVLDEEDAAVWAAPSVSD